MTANLTLLNFIICDFYLWLEKGKVRKEKERTLWSECIYSQTFVHKFVRVVCVCACACGVCGVCVCVCMHMCLCVLYYSCV